MGNSKKGQLEKIFNFTLHQKMHVKITEKYKEYVGSCPGSETSFRCLEEIN